MMDLGRFAANSTCFGTLKDARRSRQKATISSEVAVAPLLRTTNAWTVYPRGTDRVSGVHAIVPVGYELPKQSRTFKESLMF
jgi:hypothetical protein